MMVYNLDLRAIESLNTGVGQSKQPGLVLPGEDTGHLQHNRGVDLDWKPRKVQRGF